MELLRKKVLIVGAFPPPNTKIFGGIVRVCQTMLGSSFAEKYRLILVDSTQFSNPPPRLPLRFILALFRFCRFLVTLITNRPDAVIVFCSGLASVIEKGAMGWCAKLLAIPVLVFPRHAGIIDSSASNSLKRCLIHGSFKAADRFLCQGQQWQDFATEELGYSLKNAVIIPNWTATNELLEIGQARDFNVSRDKIVILFVGWLEREKGIEELLKAVKSLSDHGVPYNLKIVGRGHAETASREFVKGQGLCDNVEFMEWKEGLELVELYRDADVFVLPSWKEGLPNAMIEAMAAGLATVVTPVGNIPSFVIDDREALYVTPHDIREIENALETLILDDQKRIELAQNGHRLASEKFAVEPAMEKLIAVVDETIADQDRN